MCRPMRKWQSPFWMTPSSIETSKQLNGTVWWGGGERGLSDKEPQGRPWRKSVLSPAVNFSNEYCLLVLHVPRELQQKGDSSPWEKGEVGNVWIQSLTRNCPQSEAKWVLGKLLKSSTSKEHWWIQDEPLALDCNGCCSCLSLPGGRVRSALCWGH